MTRSIAHRGPDDEGFWFDENAGVAFGHRRLSIVDLSACGHQPMTSETGRFTAIYNGEIYNFREIRARLETLGNRFRGHSDTETMLEAFDQWGVLRAIEQMAGMFALALWDRNERKLHLVRDRFGEKPLYYGWLDGLLLFGSELKALCAHPEWHAEVDRNALALYLRYNYVPAPYTIYKGIFKAPPGKILTFSGGRILEDPIPTTFWSARGVAEKGLLSPILGTDEELVNIGDELLRTTVAQQMVADVPLGAFLSGGIDSSLVVSLMQAQSTARVKTFTIGFHENEYNEADHAQAVARHLGTDHNQLYVTSQDSLKVIPNLAAMYDEPFADASQIPTFLVASLARRQVTVSLSGDGGDELFGGYSRYFHAPPIWERMQSIPPLVRAPLSRALMSVSPEKWDQLFAVVAGGLPSRYRHKRPGYRIRKVAQVLGFDRPEAFHRLLVSNWTEPLKVVLGAEEPPTVLTNSNEWLTRGGVLERMMYLDSVSYLPDDILVKVDRATMAVSLESRAPLLDHRVAEFAWGLPQHMKVRRGQGKWILRKILARYVPPNLIDRPKMGFGVPIDHWLRGPLREWAEALINPARIAREGFFNPASIREKWDEHQSGRRNWQYPLWGVLMFQSWLENQSATRLHSAA